MQRFLTISILTTCFIAPIVVFVGRHVAGAGVDKDSANDGLRRLASDGVERRRLSSTNANLEALPDWATTWCTEQELHPLPYEKCAPDSTLNVIKLHGGMTNALRSVLLAAIMSFEEGRCFYVDEEQSHLNVGGTGFLNKYFEPIGLQKDHPFVLKAYAEQRLQVRDWLDFWNTLEQRKAFSTHVNIPSLDYHGMEGHYLKRIMMRRLWRPLPQVRDSTCRALENHGLSKTFMAFSVRRGDKTIEKFSFTQLSDYIYKADEVIGSRYGGNAPPIFVATDDCTVMPTFRDMRPDWRFESECPEDQQHENARGFVINDMYNWSSDQTSQHFRKFFVELFALATSDVYIGVAYTNVAWWAFFMRPKRGDFHLLDKSEKLDDAGLFNNW